MPKPLTIAWLGGTLEIAFDPDVGNAVLATHSYEIEQDEDDPDKDTRGDLTDTVTQILSVDECRKLFNWLGAYLHGG